jgi:hypothetical protein
MTEKPRLIPTSATGDYCLTEEHIRSWRENGFCLMSNLLQPELISQVSSVAHEYYMQQDLNAKKDFGADNNREMIFPSLQEKYQCINQIPLNE